MTEGANLPAAMPRVRAEGGEALTNTRDVAEWFGKRPKDVADDCRRILGHAADHGPISGHVQNQRVSAWFREVRAPHPTVPGRFDVSYDLTRDGFSLLAMGFTGARAFEFKVRYIAAFNALETALRQVGGHAAEIDRRIAAILAIQENTERYTAAVQVEAQAGRKRADEAHIRIDTVEQRFESEIADIREGVKAAFQPRRPVAAETLREQLRLVRLRYNGMCPACRAARIVSDDGGKLPECESEHAHGRHLNGPADTWLTCRDCNRGLGAGTIPRARYSNAFAEFQRLRLELPGALRAAPRKARDRRIHDARQAPLALPAPGAQS